jgi:hypothetical protein
MSKPGAELPNFKVFVKLMGMTTSSNDGECLNAIRMANAQLAKIDQTWEELLAGKVRMISDSVFGDAPDPRKRSTKSTVRHTDADQINPIFEHLLRETKGSFRGFVESVHEWWEEKGYLTDGQFTALKRSYDQRRR